MVESLVIIERNGQSLKRSSLSAISLAQQLGGSYALLVLGSGVSPLAQSIRCYGSQAVLVADDPLLAEPLADRYSVVISRTAREFGATTILGASSTFTKDILPRVAALLDAPMISDVTSVDQKDGTFLYQRALFAGSLSATVRLDGNVRVLTARSTAFQIPSEHAELSPVTTIAVDPASLPTGTEFVSRQQPVSPRPDLTEARVVVSGGRPLKDKETFDRLIGGLADAFGGAVGATRAAVDAGMAPNDCQIGQTGKAVAPELYIAVGISGAIQHLAGIKDSKIIVAINRNPEAPIFQMATYGLVGDLHEIVPRMIEAARVAAP